MSKNESSYRVDLHILDHAETIYNSIDEYNPLKHKAHFKCSIDTSQLIANGFNSAPADLFGQAAGVIRTVLK